jgi:hypothetical protein
LKAYPVNALEASSLTSPQKSTYSLYHDLYNRYIEYSVDFNSNEIELTGTWNNLIDADVFIIANTNAKYANLKLSNGSNIVFQKEFEIDEYIKIIEILDANDKLQKIQIDNFALELTGIENINIGLIYIGETWELPRFVTLPKNKLQLRNEGGKTFSGQATGIPVETLKTFAVNFMRIENEKKLLIDKYINGVQTVIPHIIDPYPEAHEQFEPFFATVSDYGEKEKRDEGGFYWDFGISWEEAK